MKVLLMKYKGVVALASVLKIIVSLCLAITTYLTADLLDDAVVGNGKGVIMQVIVLLLAYSSSLLMDYLSDLAVAHAVLKLNTGLRHQMLDCMTSMSYMTFTQEESGKYVSWLSNDVTQIETNAFQNIFFILGNCATIIFTVIGLCYIHYSVLIIALLFSGVMFLLPKVIGRQMEKKSSEVSKAQEDFVSKSKDYLAGFEVLYSFNLLKNLKLAVAKEAMKLETTRLQFKKYQYKSMELIDAGRVLCQITMIGLTAALVVLKITTIGVIFPVTEYSGSLFSSISGLINRLMLIRSTKPLFEKYEIIQPTSKRRDVDFKKCIELKNVSFGYDDQKLLSNVNLCFEKGKKYVIVGPSGSGKTTLIKLILNHLPDYEGDILVDDNSIKEVETSHQVAYIGQNIHLFSESIYDNITLQQAFPEDQVLKAIEDSSLSEVINTLPEKEQTMLYENGSNLSGGQKQRIALARALIRQKPIIILDEGTSALDAQNAYEIESKLLHNESLTVIMITHHLNPTLMSQYDEVIDLGKLAVG